MMHLPMTRWLNPHRETLLAGAFLAPGFGLLGLFLLWPIVYLGYLSFTTGSFTLAGQQWVGLQNYMRLALTADFWQVLVNTAIFTGVSVVPAIAIALGLAVLLDQPFRGRGGLRAAFFIPSFLSIVAAGLGFRWIVQPEGPLNQILGWVGISPVPWLSDSPWAMIVLIGLTVWKQLGFNMMVFLAGLQSIPVSQYEAAALDGANGWQQLWHVTIPGLRPTLVFAFVTTTIFTLRSFEQVYIMTGGGPLNSTNLLVYYVYEQGFAQFDFGYAAAVAMVLLIVTMGLVVIQLRNWDEPS
jgi:multiple sugar transport system permease protein